MTVLECAYDDKWIIAKTKDRFGRNVAFWIVNKDLNVRFLSDSLGSSKRPATDLNGPYDSTTFLRKLKENAIKLELKKI